jgi:hypothetical protein
MPLQRNQSFPDPDRIYNTIIDAHRGLSDAESLSLNASLVLLLANHIGDEDIVREAIVIARAAVALKG